MTNIVVYKISLKRRIDILRILLALSFLIVIDPIGDPALINRIYGIEIAELFRSGFLEGGQFHFWNIFDIGYVLSLIYLIFIPHVEKVITIIVELLAIICLCKGVVPITFMLLYSSLSEHVPTIITVSIFCTLALCLFISLMQELIIVGKKIVPANGHLGATNESSNY